MQLRLLPLPQLLEGILVEGSDTYQQRIPPFQRRATLGMCENFSIFMRLALKYLAPK